MKFPWGESSDEHKPTFKPLNNEAGFLLDIEGRKVVALKLPSNVAEQVAGQKSGVGDVFAKLAKIWRSLEPEHWLIVANMQNGFLNDPERFAALVAESLSRASGVTIPVSNLVIHGAKRVVETEKQAELPLAA